MKYDRVDSLSEGQGGFLGLLGGFSRVGHEPWCSRAPRRALVAEIIRWETARAGTIGGPECTGVVLNTLHACTVRTALGCCEGYRPGSHARPHVSGSP